MLCKKGGLLMEGRREDRAQVMLEADFEAHHNRIFGRSNFTRTIFPSCTSFSTAA